ncbi:methyl-accepting chemotaxis protein [Desulfovibrio sp. OttesenSCG-928-I05]|nr:methyl-accepting chemotaxis protein [Desulfovibrio sp. OttesenSCG-928-I05]
MSIGRKLNLLIASLLLLVSLVIILFNAYSFQAGMRAQLVDRQLPAMADGILAALDRKIMEPARGLELLVRNPILQDWIRDGEPNDRVDLIYRLLETTVSTYGTLGANFVSQGTKQYTDLSGGKRDYAYRVDEKKDTWFTGFRDSGVELNIVVYVGDPDWGTKAFINRRVTANSAFAGLFSVSIDIEEFARDLAATRLGKQGRTLIVDDKGFIRLAEDHKQLNKALAEVYPPYAGLWKNIAGRESYSAEYATDDDTRYIITRKIPILNWYLVTEASGDEFLGEVRQSTWISIVISLLFVIAGCLIGVVFVRGISRPLRQTARFAKKVSGGALDVQLDIDRKDEIGTLAHALREMVDSLKRQIAQAGEQTTLAKAQTAKAEDAMRESEQQKNIVNGILDAIRRGTEEAGGISLALSQASTKLGSESTRVSHGAEHQYALLRQADEAISEMMTRFGEITQGTSEAAKRVEAARQQAQNGEERVRDAIEANAQVNEAADAMQEAMSGLERQADGINRIIETISDIADQTNLLALNAAIEAARAGEAGRGFAVVADEVRKLAEKTMQATREVSQAVTSIQNSAEQNLQIMEKTYTAVHRATDMAENSGEAMRSIVSLSDENADQVNRIADSAADLVRHSEGITTSLREVNSVAQSTIAGMSSSSDILRDIITQASRLDKLMQDLRDKS